MLITTANARILNARSLEVRRAARQHAQEREALIKKLLAAEENRLLQAAEACAQLPANAPDDSYLAERLARVRQQIAMMDARLEEEKDPAAADRIVSAISRLAEMERLYAQRPLPGSRRPGNERKPPFVFTRPDDA